MTGVQQRKENSKVRNITKDKVYWAKENEGYGMGYLEGNESEITESLGNAWFANNNTVTATGMSVQATTDNSLLISNSQDGTYGSIANKSSSATAMKPTTSYEGKTFAILDSDKTKVENAGNFAAVLKNGNPLDATGLKTETTNSNSTYWLDTVYYLKYNGDASVNVYVPKIEVTVPEDDTKGFNKCIRVAVSMDNGSTWYAYNPQSGTATTVGKYDTSWSLVTPNYSDGSISIGSLSTNTPTQVTIRLWFEGQDTYCTTDNCNTSGFSVTVDFSTVPSS